MMSAETTVRHICLLSIAYGRQTPTTKIVIFSILFTEALAVTDDIFDSDIFYIAAEIGKEIDTHMTNFFRTGHSGRKWRREIAD